MSMGGESGAIQRVLEIASSTRVLRERRLAALRASPDGVLLGRHFLNLRGVAEHCAAETGVGISNLLDQNGFERIVRHCASASRSLGRLLDSRPGLAGALSASLRDLYDAGVGPEQLTSEQREIRQVYEAMLATLARLQNDGIYERVGLFQLACRGAADWIRRLGIAGVEVHGATELVGSAGDLVEALAKEVPLRMFQADWANAYAEELRENWPWQFSPESVEIVETPALSRDGEIPDGVLQVSAPPSPREEIEAVARAILRLFETGTQPGQICVVARSLETHAAWIESVFAEFDIPYTSSLSEPFIRHPEARRWLDLAEALLGGLETAPTLRVLISTRLVATREDASRLPIVADFLARHAGVVRGMVDWRAGLDQAAQIAKAERVDFEPGDFEALGSTLEVIADSAASLVASKSFAECGIRLMNAMDALFDPPEDEETRQIDADVRGALAGMAGLDYADQAAESGNHITRDELLEALEQVLRSLKRSPREADCGGVRVLDALQARGVPCDHLMIVGLAHGNWPREHREDPFLPGAAREALRQKTGRPVPTAKRADAEERFLLGLMLSQARMSVRLSWASEDSSGRPVAPSSLLRSLPFVGPRTSVVEHAEAEGNSDDLLARGSGLVRGIARISTENSSQLLLDLTREFATELVPPVRAGLAQIAAVEQSDGEDLSYDGAMDPDAVRRPERFSPSHVEMLGRCPLSAFFSRSLRVHEVQSPPPDALEKRERGSFLHRALACLYQRLFDTGALAPGESPERALERARELLPEAIETGAEELRKRLRERHPRVWTSLKTRLMEAADDFCQRDLSTLLPDGLTELAVEQEIRFGFDTAAGRFDLRGTPDRVLTLNSGETRMGDYKSNSNVASYVRRPGMARGEVLQLPLYVLGTAQVKEKETVSGEALPVEPWPLRDRNNQRAKRASLSLSDVEECVPRVLDVLATLQRDALFPFRRGLQCEFCAYEVACRKNHSPSEQRVTGATAFRDYFALHGVQDE